MASRCCGTVKTPVGFDTSLTYLHTKPSAALGLPEDKTWVFAGALNVSPSSIKIEDSQSYISSPFLPLRLGWEVKREGGGVVF